MTNDTLLKAVALALAVTFVSFLSVAAQHPAGPLAFLVGSFDVDVEMHFGGPPASAKGRAIGAFGPGERSILLDYEATDGPMAGFELHQIVTWDENASSVTLVWVDSRNAGATVVRGERRGDQYVFDRRVRDGDVETVHRSVYTNLTPTSFRAESYVSENGGEFRPSLVLVYRRTD